MSDKLLNCRCCKSTKLLALFSLGSQAYSGIFKTSPTVQDTVGELCLVSCSDCGLVQLGNRFPIDPFFTIDYGYASGATQYMRNHLKEIVESVERYYALQSGDIVIDIGCNDGTLLNYYPADNLKRVGFDPVAERYISNYSKDVVLEKSFFSRELYFNTFSAKSKVVTSISMFYDLEEPLKFAQDVESVLADDGVWIFEQSYLVSMLQTNSYDTMCHEHLEFYSIEAIDNILRRCNMQIVDLSLNELNGGSIRVVAGKKDFSVSPENSIKINLLRENEAFLLRNFAAVFSSFKANIDFQAKQLRNVLVELRNAGKTVVGYGASTKGNVILQYCRIDSGLLPVIGDITPHKNGRYTPGTGIPIENMEMLKLRRPDYYLVLPWSFREDIIRREKEELSRGAKFIFPLPSVEIVG